MVGGEGVGWGVEGWGWVGGRGLQQAPFHWGWINRHAYFSYSSLYLGSYGDRQEKFECKRETEGEPVSKSVPPPITPDYASNRQYAHGILGGLDSFVCCLGGGRSPANLGCHGDTMLAGGFVLKLIMYELIWRFVSLMASSIIIFSVTRLIVVYMCFSKQISLWNSPDNFMARLVLDDTHNQSAYIMCL
jgi:hypothetical protein